MDSPLRVLFVCTANICRSAFAEVYASSDVSPASPGLEFRSAGTWGHPRHPIDPPMARQLDERGVSSASFRSHQVTPDDVAWADVVLTMEESHREFLLDDHPTALTKVFTLGHFVDRAAGADLRGHDLLADLARRRGGVHPGEDVRDPYGRGDEAAARAATRIADLVDTTIVALG